MNVKRTPTIDIDVYLPHDSLFTGSSILHYVLWWLILETPHSYSRDAFKQQLHLMASASFNIYKNRM